MDKQNKLKQAIQLQQAKKTGDEAFILLEKLDQLEDKVDSIKPTDLTELNTKLDTLTEKVEEDIEIDLIIE